MFVGARQGPRDCAASAWLQAAGGEGSSEPAVEWTAARSSSSSRPARTRVRWVPVGGVGRARRPGGGGTLCLALPTPRTDSSGAQGLWKANLQPNHS